MAGDGGKHVFSLTQATLPKNVIECGFAVRGAVVLKAEELEAKLRAKEALPFESTVACNVGNPQAAGQAPLTFHRQVLACLADPALLEHEWLYPSDVKDRARRYLAGIKDGRVGAYSHSKGHLVFRKDVAEFFRLRDGADCDPDDIFLTDGSTPAVKLVLQMCVGRERDGVLLPIPQYPLYRATIALLGGEAVGYALDDAGRSATLSEVERAVSDFRSRGGVPRAITLVNPGNPNGQILSRETIEGILRFAERQALAVLADEVYQDNVHVFDKQFVSCRQVAVEIRCKAEVFSFHSASKGVIGECGLRGGCVHCHNVDPDVKRQMYKFVSLGLCSNVLGQALMASVVTLPPEGGPSRAKFDAERAAIREALRRKACRVTERLNRIPGMSCRPIQGAMYAFPTVEVTAQLSKEALESGIPADELFCLQMLEKTGVVTVPGSAFAQKGGDGTCHFRITILPDEAKLEKVLDAIEKFQLSLQK